ncbi:MAG TPA: helix-turn-helix transcriptional regulator, partial [Armatimonadota bacterium]|nr:helix-turn-helix transcriptional regulator [Armatimonadota bacterium]
VYDSAAHNACISHDSYWYLAQELYTLVRSGDIDQVDRVLGNTIKHFFLHVYAPLTHLVTILQCQIILMAQAAREVGVHPTEIDSDTERYLEQLGTTYDYAQLQKLIEDGARLFTTKVHDHFHCPSSRLVSATEEYIKAHLDDPAVSLQQIADALCTNPSYLSRSFKKAKGHGITEYINRQRVETAKRLLLDRKLQITDIAFQLGFGSLQHFGRVFKAIADCSPSDYRQSKNVQEE